MGLGAAGEETFGEFLGEASFSQDGRTVFPTLHGSNGDV